MNRALSFLFCALVAPVAMAEAVQETSGDWSFSGYGSQVSIDSQTAAEQGIEDSAWIIGFSGDYIRNSWVTSVGVDIVVYDDNQKFRQDVEGTGLVNRGDRSTESSSANGGVIFVASGYQWLYGEEQNIAVRLQGGFGVMTFSERSIASCTNCFSEDIDVDGGLFAKATVLRTGESLSFGLYYQQYLTGDGLNSAFGITLASPF